MATDVMALNNSSFVELTNDEMMLVDGGWNILGMIGSACGMAASVIGMCFCVAAEPETLGGSTLAFVGCYLGFCASLAGWVAACKS